MNYKVVWKRMTTDLISAVATQHRTLFGYKTIIPVETVTFFSTDDEPEAHYLCAIINSNPVRDFIKSFSSAGRGFGTPSVMEHIGIPKFDLKIRYTKSLPKFPRCVTSSNAKAKKKKLKKLEKENDKLVKKLFGSFALCGATYF